MGMNVIAIIPARGGSKGIPRKNLQLLGGQPLVARAVRACCAAQTVARVIVSSDDAEIGEIAERHGAEVIWRPSEISGDDAQSEDAVLHVVETLGRSEDGIPDAVLLVQCTSPLTLPEDIDGTVMVMRSENADCALTVAPSHGFLWRRDAKAGAVGINHNQDVRLRRQKLDLQYLETGSVYAMRTDGFLEARHRFFGKVALYVMPAKRCLEIDEPEDLVVAEVLVRQQQRHARAQLLPWPIEALVLDFDGVLTDNHVCIDENGREAVNCSRSDGWALGQLGSEGLPILVLSTEKNPVVKARCSKLGLPCIQGSRDKLADLRAWARDRQVSLSNVIYVGNDVNDLPCLEVVGCGIVVADAHPDVLLAARIVLDADGGQGAVRELADIIVQRLKEG